MKEYFLEYSNTCYSVQVVHNRLQITVQYDIELSSYVTFFEKDLQYNEYKVSCKWRVNEVLLLISHDLL